MHCNAKPLVILSFDIKPLAIQSYRKHFTVCIADMADKLARYVVVAEVVTEVVMEVAVEVAEVAAEVVAEVVAEVAAEIAAEILAEVLLEE